MIQETVLDRNIYESDLCVRKLLYRLFMPSLKMDTSLGGRVPDPKRIVHKTMHTLAAQRNHMRGIIMAQIHWKIEGKLTASFICFLVKAATPQRASKRNFIPQLHKH